MWLTERGEAVELRVDDEHGVLDWELATPQWGASRHPDHGRGSEPGLLEWVARRITSNSSTALTGLS